MFRKLCFWRRGPGEAQRPACLPGPIPAPTPLDTYRLEVLTPRRRIWLVFTEAIRAILNTAPEKLGELLGLDEPYTIHLEQYRRQEGANWLPVTTYYFPIYGPKKPYHLSAARPQAGGQRSIRSV
jgi:hypothetical protein